MCGDDELAAVVSYRVLYEVFELQLILGRKGDRADRVYLLITSTKNASQLSPFERSSTFLMRFFLTNHDCDLFGLRISLALFHLSKLSIPRKRLGSSFVTSSIYSCTIFSRLSSIPSFSLRISSTHSKTTSLVIISLWFGIARSSV